VKIVFNSAFRFEILIDVKMLTLPSQSGSKEI